MIAVNAMLNNMIDGAIKARLFGDNYAYIKSIDNTVLPDAPVYAINWFNTKRMWLYNLYNVLAVPSVLAINASPYFKGEHIKTLHGGLTGQRDVLLIVRYPSPYRFKKMLESLYFKLVSILRIAAVKNFTFGFATRNDDGSVSNGGNKSATYAVHHYTGAGDISGEVQKIAKSNSIDVFFAGRISALLYSGGQKSAHKQIPCLMDGIILLRSDAGKNLEELTCSTAYQAVLEKTESSFIGLYKRTL